MNNKVGTYEYIEYSEVVAGVKMRLGIKDSSEDDAFITDLCNTAAKRIKNRGTQPQAITTLQIVNFKAKLPTGFIKFAHPFPIVYVDEFGNAPVNGWYAPKFINNAFFEDSPFGDRVYICGGTVTINNGYLYFSTDVTARFCKISFLTGLLDANGQVALHAIAEDAVMAFCCWQYGLTFGGFDQYRMETWRKQWKNGKRELKGFFNGDEGYDRPLIAYIMNTLI